MVASIEYEYNNVGLKITGLEEEERADMSPFVRSEAIPKKEYLLMTPEITLDHEGC
jgi:hypothetical protein